MEPGMVQNNLETEGDVQQFLVVGGCGFYSHSPGEVSLLSP